MTKSRGPRTEPWGHHRGKYTVFRKKTPTFVFLHNAETKEPI